MKKTMLFGTRAPRQKAWFCLLVCQKPWFDLLVWGFVSMGKRRFQVVNLNEEGEYSTPFPIPSLPRCLCPLCRLLTSNGNEELMLLGTLPKTLVWSTNNWNEKLTLFGTRTSSQKSLVWSFYFAKNPGFIFWFEDPYPWVRGCFELWIWMKRANTALR